MAEPAAPGSPVGRRVVLGLLGLGAAGVVVGSRVQDGLSRVLAPIQMRDPTGLTSLVPLGDTWRYYSVTGAVDPRDPATYSLRVSGLVDRPGTYSLAELEALPQASFTDTFHCVTGWHVPDVPWRGVLLADLIERAAPAPGASAVRFRSFDGAYVESMTLDQARADGVIVATRMYDEPVTHDHGGPVRIYASPMFGYKSTKWLSEIELVAQREPGYWEERGYSLDGYVDA